jgi:HEAT repeat protein
VASRSEKKDFRNRIVRAKIDGDIEAMLRLLQESALLGDPGDRRMTAKYLGDLGAQEAVKPLIRLLSADDVGMRSQAADSLSKIGATEAVPELLKRLRLEERFAPRAWTIEALGRLGDSQAVEPLCKLLSDDHVLIRQAAAEALGKIGDPSALEPLQESAARERWIDRRTHRKAIRKIRALVSEKERAGKR